MLADIAGSGVLGEGPAIGVHPKHWDRQIYIDSDLRFIGHAIGGSISAQQRKHLIISLAAPPVLLLT